MIFEFPTQAAGEWSEEQKERWRALRGSIPTHVVSCSPRITLEVVIPPWEHGQTRVARAAVQWSAQITDVLREAGIPGVEVVGVHCEDSSYRSTPIAGLAARTHPERSAIA